MIKCQVGMGGRGNDGRKRRTVLVNLLTWDIFFARMFLSFSEFVLLPTSQPLASFPPRLAAQDVLVKGRG